MKKETIEIDIYTLVTLIVTVIITIVLLVISVKYYTEGRIYNYATNAVVETNTAMKKEEEISEGKIIIEEEELYLEDVYQDEATE